MQVFFFFTFSLVFSQSVSAVTLGEVGAAAGVASTLQGTAQTQQKGTLDKVKQTVQHYEQNQEQKIKEAQGIYSATVPSSNNRESSSSDLPRIPQMDSMKHLTKEELEERFQDEGVKQKTNPVDYKAKVQIFYKRKCAPSQKNCNRGAVLTNIKSVIF